ncbi:MAG: DUF192 domain-containing protein [bacterium]
MSMPHLFIALVLLLCAATCSFGDSTPLQSCAIAEAKLPVIELSIGQHKIRAEVADTLEPITRGLMFREKLGADEGMLFVFSSERRASFWMKNTRLPLSVAYLDRTGKILEIYLLEPFNETSVQSHSTSVRFALEMNRGWFESKNIKTGDAVRGLPSN